MQMRDIRGFEARYAVSDDGRVWSKYTKRWLAPCSNHSGYLKVGLSAEDGHREKRFVHRLVCEAFHGPPPESDYQVDHINGNHCDNCIENLRWVSGDENLEAADARGIGKRRRPVVGFNAEGDVVRFESISRARKCGFNNVRHCLANPLRLCKGYRFVYAEDWNDDIPQRLFER